MYLVLHIVISHFNYKLQKDKAFQSLGPHDNSQNINMTAVMKLKDVCSLEEKL